VADERLYLDTSALMKLLVNERETAVLRAATAGSQLTSSELALVELPRAAYRFATRHPVADGSALLAEVERLLDRLVLVPLDRGQLLLAGAFPDAHLRSLDAMHLAAALTVAEGIDAVVTYDRRLSRVAARHDLPVMAPA
jgi:predicted nucleic acid-binding protein